MPNNFMITNGITSGRAEEGVKLKLNGWRDQLMRGAWLMMASILRRSLLCGGVVIVGTLLAAPPSHAAQAPAQPSPPGQSSQPSLANPSSNGAPSSNSADAAPAANYNPLPAENDVEVATFYVRKGDPDAAIPRLEEAIKLKPDYAKPRLMLGDIYEKKGDKQNAVKYYSDYLRVYPHAPDAKKVRQKIAKMSGQ